MSGDDHEVEENVWKINEEQRVYYLNQFRVLQPAEKGVVTGRSQYPFKSFFTLVVNKSNKLLYK